MLRQQKEIEAREQRQRQRNEAREQLRLHRKETTARLRMEAKERLQRQRMEAKEQKQIETLKIRNLKAKKPSATFAVRTVVSRKPANYNMDSPPPRPPMEFEGDTYRSLEPSELAFTPLDVPQPPAPRLAHNLDRVLFNQGVYRLRDHYSGVYNFDPYLEDIMQPNEFDFTALPEYKTSSEDTNLAAIATSNHLKYVGSTSSMTSVLSHFHYLLSSWRPLNFSLLSKGFELAETTTSRDFTKVFRAPQAIYLRWRNGTYAIDGDKEFSEPNILMSMGLSLEKLLTIPAADFERFRKGDEWGVPASERNATQSYHYSKQGNMLMRSQLDASDPRLPGAGVFDLKTRAVLPVRMSSRNFEPMTGYQIMSQTGDYESFEREVYDMFRSTALKYSLQVRMGRMEGIFIAYHNIKEIFGFQFMTRSDLDEVLHGQRDTRLGDQEFRVSLELLQQVLDRVVETYPEQSIRLYFETDKTPTMHIVAEPMEEAEIEELSNASKKELEEYRRKHFGFGDEDEFDSAIAAAVAHNEGPLPYSEGSTDIGTPIDSSSDTSSSDKTLLAFRLNVNNVVDGTIVHRPENLGESHKWTVRYELQRIDDQGAARTLYEAIRRKREQILCWEDEEVEEAEEKPPPPQSAPLAGNTIAEAMASQNTPTLYELKELKKESAPKQKKKKTMNPAYLALLRNYSEKGRQIRLERQKADAALKRQKVVVGGGEVTSVPQWAIEAREIAAVAAAAAAAKEQQQKKDTESVWR